MSVTKSDLLEVLYDAVHEPHGVAVSSDNNVSLLVRLGRLVKEEGLALRLSKMEDEIWITHKGKDK